MKKKIMLLGVIGLIAIIMAGVAIGGVSYRKEADNIHFSGNYKFSGVTVEFTGTTVEMKSTWLSLTSGQTLLNTANFEFTGSGTTFSSTTSAFSGTSTVLAGTTTLVSSTWFRATGIETHAGAETHSGDITTSGTGTHSGANTFTGGVTSSAGTALSGGVTVTGSVWGTRTDNGAITFAGNNTFSGENTVTGGVTVSGVAKLNSRVQQDWVAPTWVAGYGFAISGTTSYKSLFKLDTSLATGKGGTYSPGFGGAASGATVVLPTITADMDGWALTFIVTSGTTTAWFIPTTGTIQTASGVSGLNISSQPNLTGDSVTFRAAYNSGVSWYCTGTFIQ